MKNIFRAFGSQSTTTEIELGEQDLEQVTGAHGRGCDYNDDDHCDYDDDNYCHHR